MDDTDDFIDEPDTVQQAASDDKFRLQCAFGDNVAQRFLRLRGIDADMHAAVLARQAEKQAMKLARDALLQAAFLRTAPLFQRAPRPSTADCESALAGPHIR
jgi:hypothetical protein